MEISRYGDPVLTARAAPVTEINDEVRALAQTMLETMYENEGIGLAAPQVGVSLRLIVLDIGAGPLILVNPEIVARRGDREPGEEGCLSLPKIYLSLDRYQWIKVKGLDMNGQEVALEASGLLARVIQHEVDHLDGFCIADRADFVQRARINDKLKRLVRQAKRSKEERDEDLG
jgi:peptide deformylase